MGDNILIAAKVSTLELNIRNVEVIITYQVSELDKIQEMFSMEIQKSRLKDR